MKIKNPIGWCDATTNAVTGCDKVSPGCKNCYAEVGTRARVLRAQGKETWGARGEREPVNFEPVFRRLNKLVICDCCHETFTIAVAAGNLGKCKFCDLGRGNLRRPRLFADSNSDWLDPKWPVETLAMFLDAIRLAPNVDVQLLTKRMENFQPQLQTCWRTIVNQQPDLAQWIYNWDCGTAPHNVWLGVSVEDQKRADERIPALLKTPAAVRFLSCEPLLGEVDLNDLAIKGSPDPDDYSYGTYGVVDWVIVGGESGKYRRDCGVERLHSVWAQCAAAGVKCYVKQDAALLPGQRGRICEAAWLTKEFPV